jgi:ribonuclease E
MKRMLFNATQQEELRVAIVDGQRLIDIDIESNARELHKSNIYKAVITRIEPSLEACFVNYSEDRHGFLPFKEVARSLFKEGIDVRSATIKDALTEGQEVMVQVEKEERGNKGAALTTFISLAGRYLVLMPNNPRGGGVSRRVEGEERQELRETMEKLDVPPGMSIIARTAGIGRSVEELQWDLNYLLQLWRAIESAGSSAPGAFLIYHESSLVIRAIRDYFQPDIGEILIDTDEIYEQARQFMSYVMPDMVNRVKRYRDAVPLFSRFQIEHQIESAYSRIVSLPSGGSIVIDHTEALVAIDVNSARSTRGTDIETTAFTTNCEAAEEVARQLRLRDLGGLIVIDFIDMESSKNRREIESRLKEALRYDRARVQMEKITRFGLMELSRQRLRPSLSEGSHIACPRCNGTGHIRDTESSALQVLRIIEEESMKESSAVIHVQVPVDVAAFLLNEKRGEIIKVESLHKVEIVLIPNKYLETPHYRIERIKHDDPRLEMHQVSYKLAEESDTDMGFSKRLKEPQKPQQEAVVKNIPEGLPAPVIKRDDAPVTKVEETGFFGRLLGLFGIGGSTPAEPPKPAAAPEVESNKETRKPKANERLRRNRRGDKEEQRNKEAVEGDTATGGKPQRQRRNKNEKQGRSLDERRQPKPELAQQPNADEEIQLKSPAQPEGEVTAPDAVQETRHPRRDRRNRLRNRRENFAEEGLVTEGTVTQEATSSDDNTPSFDGDGKGPRNPRRQRTRRPRMNQEEQVPSVEEVPVQVEVAAPVEAEPKVEMPAVVEAAAPQEVASVEVPTVEPVAVEPPAVEAVVAEAPAVEPVVDAPAEPAVEMPAPVETPAEAVSGEQDQVEVQQPEVVAETPVEVAPVVEEPVVAEAADTPVDKASAEPETTAASPAVDAESELDRILKEAGLTMASTNPEKMRQVQATQVEEAPRPVRRRRKRVVVVDEGPLIQVDTKQG